MKSPLLRHLAITLAIGLVLWSSGAQASVYAESTALLDFSCTGTGIDFGYSPVFGSSVTAGQNTYLSDGSNVVSNIGTGVGQIQSSLPGSSGGAYYTGTALSQMNAVSAISYAYGNSGYASSSAWVRVPFVVTADGASIFASGNYTRNYADLAKSSYSLVSISLHLLKDNQAVDMSTGPLNLVNLAYGSTPVTFTDTGTVNGPFVANLKAGDTGYLTFRAQTGTNIPVPAAAWLFGSGLITLVGVRMKKHNETGFSSKGHRFFPLL